MSNFEGSVLVEFNSKGSDDYILYAKLDDVLNLDLDGNIKSQFGSEEKGYVIVNHSDNVTVDSVEITHGSVNYYGSGSRTISEKSLYASKDKKTPSEYSVPVIPSSTSFKYFGRNGGFSSKKTENGIITLTADISKVPFVSEISTSYAVKIYEFTTPKIVLADNEIYDIYVVFYATVRGKNV